MQFDSNVPNGPLSEKWDKHLFDLKLVNPANKRKFEIIVVGTGLAGNCQCGSSGWFIVWRSSGCVVWNDVGET